MISHLTDSDLDDLRDHLRRDGDLAGAADCTLVLKARARLIVLSPAVREMAERTVLQRWETRDSVQAVEDMPTLTRAITRETKPEPAQTIAEINAEWRREIGEV